MNNMETNYKPQKVASNDIELRSEKVRQLLGEIPPALVTWGKAIILFIFLVLIIVICFVPYPHSQGESILQHLIKE